MSSPSNPTDRARGPHDSDTTKEKKSKLFRGMSRKKSVRSVDVDSPERKAIGMSRTMSRGMSRKRSICEKITRSKEDPLFGSRAKTGASTLKAKQRVIDKYPELEIQFPSTGDKAEQLVFQGLNSIRAEVIDFNAMIFIMQDNMKMLTHRAVERFFDWIPLFKIYLERYMLVEEDLIFKWVERETDAMKGAIRPSARMVMRGKMQKQIDDVQAAQDRFMPHLPAGERLSYLVDVADGFTKLVGEYLTIVATKLPPIIKATFEKSDIDKMKIRIMKHLIAHIGYQDFIAIFTRWMRPGELLEWKSTVLFPCDFKFFSYGTWDKDMDAAHYQIAARFAEALNEENEEAVELNKQSKVDFDRALANRKHVEEEEEEEDGEEDDFGIEGLDAEKTQEKECM